MDLSRFYFSFFFVRARKISVCVVTIVRDSRREEGTLLVVAVYSFSTVRRRIRDGQKTRHVRGYRFSPPSTHPRPHQSAPLRCIAAGDAAKCDAAPFLSRAARGRRAMRPMPLFCSKLRRWGTGAARRGGRRKSDIG